MKGDHFPLIAMVTPESSTGHATRLAICHRTRTRPLALCATHALWPPLVTHGGGVGGVLIESPDTQGQTKPASR